MCLARRAEGGLVPRHISPALLAILSSGVPPACLLQVIGRHHLLSCIDSL